MAYYAMGRPLADLARSLRRDERTVRDWLNGRTRVPWWVPEVLRLRRMELDLRMRQMGMGALPPLLGIVGADVIALPTQDAKKPQDGLRLVESSAPVPAIA
jgi:hypothetical protein